MKRDELMSYILETYGVTADFPWFNDTSSAVFRNKENKKWFALLMRIKKSNLGLEGNDEIEVLNLKCSPLMLFDLLKKEGFYPAYHMNKNNWISVAIEHVKADELEILLDLSFNMIKPKKSSAM